MTVQNPLHHALRISILFCGLRTYRTYNVCGDGDLGGDDFLRCAIRSYRRYITHICTDTAALFAGGVRTLVMAIRLSVPNADI